MCDNSLIYLTTPTASTIPSGAVLPLSTIVRRRGGSIQQSNDSVILGKAGYYRISISATFTAPAAGNVTLESRIDGVPVSGAVASTTITTATTEVRSISFDAIVRVPCCGSPVTLTIVNTGVAINTSNVAVNVEYLD